MDLSELQRRVDRVLKLDLKPHHDAYRAQGGGDIEGFLAFLAATRAIEPSALKELYGMTDVTAPRVLRGSFKGTPVGAWAKTGMPDGAPVVSARGSLASLPSLDLRFRPISRLGTGAMGAIDIAEDVHLRRRVALKTVLPEVATLADVCDRFLAEMQITAQLEHPNIVPVYALDVTTDGSLGYAMKLVQGKDLSEILDEARAKIERGEPLGEELTLEKRLEYFIKVCDAVEYAHSKGILHRDLKPANVMIGRHNEVYLMDWGIARVIGAAEAAPPSAPMGAVEATDGAGGNGADVGRTQAGQTIGTPQYMSPEQALGKNAELTAESDQYAMGLILQECVTLKTAVDGASVQEVLTKAMLGKRDPVPIGVRPGTLPREIDAIVRKATMPNPKERYPSVRALGDEVRRFIRGEPVEALAEGPARRAGRWLSKHRMATLTLLLGIGFVGAAGTVGSLIVGQARIEANHQRELRVSQMVAESALQTQLVDRDLTRYEAALSEFVGAAQVVLRTMPQSEATTYLDDSFRSRETAPPDFGPSKVYGRDVSVTAPLTILPSDGAAPPEALLHALATLGPDFRALMLSSSGADWRALTLAAQRALITDVGVAASRASLRLREGITLSFPGAAGRPPGDAREAAAVKLTEGKTGVVWGTPITEDGESILPASAALYDERGAFRGAVMLQVSLSRLLARPTAAELDYVQSRSLVGRDGNVVAEDNKAEGRVPLAPEVAAAIAAGKSGSMVAEVNGRRYQYAFHPLSTVDWYYVSAGEVGRMLNSKERTVVTDPRAARRAPPPVMARTAKADAPPPTVTQAPAPPPPTVETATPLPTATVATHVDAGAPRVPGPKPKSSAEAPDPFEKWKYYERKKKKP